MVWHSLYVKLGYIVLLGLLGVQTFYAFTNGHIVENPYKVLKNSECYDRDDVNVMVDCCEWKLENGSVVWVGFASFAFLWLSFMAMELRVFIVSGSITQW